MFIFHVGHSSLVICLKPSEHIALKHDRFDDTLLNNFLTMDNIKHVQVLNDFLFVFDLHDYEIVMSYFTHKFKDA